MMGKYWIEDANEIFPEDDDAAIEEKPDIQLWITRSLLSDEHKSGVTDGDQSQAVVSKKPPTTASLATSVTEPVANTEQKGQRKPASLDKHILEQAEQHTGNDNKHDDDVVDERDPVIFIKRTFENKPFHFKNSPTFRQLANGDCGDGIVNPHPKDQIPDKYWAQRKRLFSRFEQGIQLDQEGWYSVTPEAIAKHIAKRMVSSFATAAAKGSRRMIVLDAFCGVGGNSIALAARSEVDLVIAVDTDHSRLEMTANNCRVYEIPREKVLLIHGDTCKVLEAYSGGSLLVKTHTNDEQGSTRELHGYKCGGLDLLPDRLDAIFLSPPWGGTSYTNIGPRQYDLGMIHVHDNLDGERLLHLAKQALAKSEPKNIVYFLPRNTNGMSFARSAFQCGFRGNVEFEMNLLNLKFKTITAYLDVVAPSNEGGNKQMPL